MGPLVATHKPGITNKRQFSSDSSVVTMVATGVKRTCVHEAAASRAYVLVYPGI
jgi:hypothetical protein